MKRYANWVLFFRQRALCDLYKLVIDCTEKQIAQLKSQQSKTSTSNVDHVSLIESLRAETEVR